MTSCISKTLYYGMDSYVTTLILTGKNVLGYIGPNLLAVHNQRSYTRVHQYEPWRAKNRTKVVSYLVKITSLKKKRGSLDRLNGEREERERIPWSRRIISLILYKIYEWQIVRRDQEQIRNRAIRTGNEGGVGTDPCQRRNWYQWVRIMLANERG